MLPLVRPFRRVLRRPTLASYFHTSYALWSRKIHKTFKLADIGEGITECEVIKWSVQPSASIQAFDALCEVQSDKASVEITSPFDGVIKELLVKEGEIAKVGAGLCVIEVSEEEADTSDDAPEATPPPHPEQAAAGSGVTVPPSQVESPTPEPAALSSPKRRPHPLDPNVTPEQAPLALGANSENVLATPSVRHFARQKGVDLSQLAPGSGKGGRVEKKDVENHLSGASSIPARQGTPSASKMSVDQSQDVVVELGRTRYGMWKAMVKSLEIPHFGYSTSLDLTTLNEILPILTKNIPAHYLLPTSTSSRQPPAVSPASLYPPPSPPEVPSTAQITKLTYLPILLKTLSKAMVEWPLFRSSITPSTSPSDKPSLTVRPHADVSIALSTPTGLYTPTIQRVDTHSVYSLASQIMHLSQLGRQTPCGLTPTEMPKRGGTVTVSNIGGIGDGEGASPVLVPGTGVAIVAVGRAKWVWDVNRGDGQGERRLKVSVSWSADHRVVEGAELVAFIETWRQWVENPYRLIGEAV